MPHGERHALGPAHCLCLEHRHDLKVRVNGRNEHRSPSEVCLRQHVRPVLDQHPHHRRVTLKCAYVERRQSMAVVCRHVRPVLKQQAGHRPVPFKCGEMQCRPSVRFLGRHVGPVLKQYEGHRLAPTTCACGVMKRRDSIVVLDVQQRPVLQEQLHHLRVTLMTSDLQRRG